MEYVVPFKRDNKKTQLCMSSNNNFLKYSLHNTFWVRKTVMKPVDAVGFPERKAQRETQQ